MGGYILREEEKNIVLPLDAVERLIAAGNGDAALLYLELQRIDTGVTAQRLMQRLRWSQLRLNAAESELQRMGLLPSGTERKPLDPPEDRQVRGRKVGQRVWGLREDLPARDREQDRAADRKYRGRRRPPEAWAFPPLWVPLFRDRRCNPRQDRGR